MSDGKNNDAVWQGKESSPDSARDFKLNRQEFMEIVRSAQTTPCPSKNELISQMPALENERHVKSALDHAQTTLGNAAAVAKRGEAGLTEFQEMMNRAGLGKLPALSSQDVTEIGKAITHLEKRCIESRIGRTS